MEMKEIYITRSTMKTILEKAIFANGPLLFEKQYLYIKETEIRSAINKNGIFKSKKKSTKLPVIEQIMLSHILPSRISLTEGIPISANPIMPIKGINILIARTRNAITENTSILKKLLFG
jgi:hypothetical protein